MLHTDHDHKMPCEFYGHEPPSGYDPKDFPGFPLGTFVYFGDHSPTNPGVMAVVTDPEALGIGCPTPGYRPSYPGVWIYWEQKHRDMVNEMDSWMDRIYYSNSNRSVLGLFTLPRLKSQNKGMWTEVKRLRKVFPDTVPMEPKLTPQEINRRADASEGGIWPVTHEFVRSVRDDDSNNKDNRA